MDIEQIKKEFLKTDVGKSLSTVEFDNIVIFFKTKLEKSYEQGIKDFSAYLQKDVLKDFTFSANAVGYYRNKLIDKYKNKLNSSEKKDE